MIQLYTLKQLMKQAEQDKNNKQSQKAAEQAETGFRQELLKHDIKNISPQRLINLAEETDARFFDDGDIYTYMWDGQLRYCYSLSQAGHSLIQQYARYDPSEDRFYFTIDNLLSVIKNAGLAQDVVICREAAAGWLGISNMYFIDEIDVYTELEQSELPRYIRKADANYSGKKTTEHCGFICTTAEQTILDMLDNDKNTDSQSLYESLADFYMKHNDSFEQLYLLMNAKQTETFKEYEYGAVHYYYEMN